MEEDHYDAFESFIKSFINGPLRDRWLSIIGFGHKRWKKLDPYDLWGKSSSGMSLSYSYPKSLDHLLVDCIHKGYGNKEVYIAYFGHAGGQYKKLSFIAAMDKAHIPLEGLIFLDPERLVICFTHEGEIRVFCQ